MLALLFIFAAVFFSLCYKYYGRFLIETFLLDDKKKTPANTLYDGVDYCPTHPQFYWGIIFPLSQVPVPLWDPSPQQLCSVGYRPIFGALSARLSWGDPTMPVL